MRAIQPPIVLTYAAAVVFSLMALGLRLAFGPVLGDQVPFVTFFIAVVFTAWYGGVGPTFVAVCVSAIGASYFFLAPRGDFIPSDTGGWIGLLFFLSFGTVTALLSGWTSRRTLELQQQRESFSVTLSSIGDAVIATDTDSRITFMNSIAQQLTGWSMSEALNQPVENVFRIIDERSRTPVESPIHRVLQTGDVVELSHPTLLIRRDNTEIPIDDSAAPISDGVGRVTGVVLVFRDITERRRAELAEGEHSRLLELRLKISSAFVTHESLQTALQECTQVIVDHLDMAFARIWTLNEQTNTLELQTSAGLYTHLDGPHSHIPVGKYKIGRIVQNRCPHLTNDVLNDPNISDPEWARREGMVAFAGYPLLLGDKVFGVIAMFARRPLSQNVLDNLHSFGDSISQFIERKRQAEQLNHSEKLHRILGELTADYGVICRLTADGQLNIELVTTGFQKVTGYTLEEVEALGGWITVIHPEDLQIVEHSISRWLEGQVDTGEIRLIAKNGDERRIEYFGRAEQLVGNQGARIFIASQDVTEKRIAEYERKRQREWLSGTLSSIGDAVIATDTQSRVTFLNRVAEQLTGWSQEDAIGHSLTDVFQIVNESTRRTVANPVEKVLQDGSIVGLANHTILIARDGGEHPIDDSAAPIRDEHGDIIGVVLVFRDVTNQKEAERRIRESEQRYRLISDAANDAIWDWDLVTNQIEWNEGIKTRFHYSADQISSDASWWVNHIHPEDRPRVVRDIHAVIDGNQEYWSDEYRFERADGSPAFVFDRGRVVRDAEGKAVRMVGSMLDLTEQRLSHEQIKEREEQYRNIFESTNDAILIFDDSGRVIEVNPAASSVYGYSRQELLRLQGTEIVHPDDPYQFSDFVEQVNSGAVFHAEGTHVRKGGGPIEIKITGSTFVFAGRPALLAVVRDVTEERQAVESQRESAALLRFTLEATEIGQWDLNVLTGSAKRTLRHDQIFGYSSLLPDWTYDKFLQHVHPEDRDWVNELFNKAVAEGTEWDYECRILTAAGEPRWIWVRGSVYHIGPDRAARMAGLVMDITERKNAEVRERQLLSEAATANAKFRAFFEQGPLFAGIMALDGTILEANQLSLEACGYSKEQVVGKRFWECPWWLPSELLCRQIQAASKQAINGDVFRTEMPYYVADGSQRIVDMTLFPIKNDTGQVIFVVPAGTDITERKQAEATLRENEQRFRTLVEQVRDYAIFMTDSEGRPTTWNEGVQRVLGFQEEEFVGQDITGRIFTDDDRQVGIQFKELADAARAGTTSSERWMLKRDGRLFYALDMTTCLLDADGLPLGFMKVTRDQTERKQMEDELRRIAADLSEADRRKDEFLAMLAHELRNPLAPIRSGLDILAMDDEVRNRDVIELMQLQVEHVVRLVDDLLDVSRIMRGKVELRRQVVELTSLVKRSVDAVRNTINDRQHKLIVHLPSEPIWLDADPVRVVQVLENLLNNASKYMDPGGRIELSAECHDGQALIKVQDQGIGIEPELLPNVFELFTQSTRSLDRSQGGLGIGLTLVQRLVEMHHGIVLAESPGIGHGSTFSIQLPVTEAPKEIYTPTAVQQNNVARRIVVVDDNRGATWLLSKLLSRFGDHEICSANDGPSALQLIREVHPEIVLLDIGLPGMDGFEVAQAIRQDSKFNDVLLVALTGYGQETDRLKSKHAGFDEHLVKPPSVDQMKIVLAHPKLKGNNGDAAT